MSMIYIEAMQLDDLNRFEMLLKNEVAIEASYRIAHNAIYFRIEFLQLIATYRPELLRQVSLSGKSPLHYAVIADARVHIEFLMRRLPVGELTREDIYDKAPIQYVSSEWSLKRLRSLPHDRNALFVQLVESSEYELAWMLLGPDWTLHVKSIVRLCVLSEFAMLKKVLMWVQRHAPSVLHEWLWDGNWLGQWVEYLSPSTVCNMVQFLLEFDLPIVTLSTHQRNKIQSLFYDTDDMILSIFKMLCGAQPVDISYIPAISEYGLDWVQQKLEMTCFTEDCDWIQQYWHVLKDDMGHLRLIFMHVMHMGLFKYVIEIADAMGFDGLNVVHVDSTLFFRLLYHEYIQDAQLLALIGDRMEELICDIHGKTFLTHSIIAQRWNLALVIAKGNPKQVKVTDAYDETPLDVLLRACVQDETRKQLLHFMLQHTAQCIDGSSLGSYSDMHMVARYALNVVNPTRPICAYRDTLRVLCMNTALPMIATFLI